MLPKITRGTLADQVAERLLEFIENQHLKPGDLLPSETSLAVSFGVSRPVVRESLKNLEGKDVIEIVNGKGAIIRPIASEPLRLFFQRAMRMEYKTMVELMEVRKGLEVQAAGLAAQRWTPKDLQAIQRVVQAMRANLGDLDSYIPLDVEFHLSVAAASHNAMLANLIESIRESLRNTIITGLKSRGSDLHLETIQKTHELLGQMIEARDVTGAMRAMEQHFDEAIESMTNPHA